MRCTRWPESEESWRRVPESNRSTRICNPPHSTENIDGDGKRPRFAHGSKSDTYGPNVNGNHGSETENPGALAGATGAQDKAGELRAKSYRESELDATWRFAKHRHKRAASIILYSLVLDDERPEGWHDASFVLRVRLTSKELIGLAFAALRALDPEPREMAFEAAHWGEVSGAGTPPPPFLNVMDDARWWADLASRSERKAYCLAAFEAMPPADQSAFLRHVQREGAR